MSDRSRWQPTSAWGQADRPTLTPTSSDEAGVLVEFLEDVALATIIVRRGQEPCLERLLKARFDSDLPQARQVAFGRHGSLVWSAPGQWLAVAHTEEAFAGLPAALATVAAVTDQGDARALVRISGAGARDILRKGFAIDLHPSVFSTGSAAVTKVAHLSVQIWQVDDAPTFLIAVPRSFAGTFRSWLNGACAASTGRLPEPVT